MPRPPKRRKVCRGPSRSVFKPAGQPMRKADAIQLTLDEYEAIRLADLEDKVHEEAAEQMHTSRPTFTRILSSARKKVATALVNSRPLVIEGGNVDITEARRFRCRSCEHSFDEPFGTGRPKGCPECGGDVHRDE